MPPAVERLPRGPLNLNSRLVDRAIRHAIHLERLKSGEVARILRLLDKHVILDLVAQLSDRLERISARGYTVTDRTSRRLEQLMDATRGTIQGGMQFVSEATKAGLIEAAALEADFTAKLMRKALPVQLDWVSPSRPILRAIVQERPFEGQVLKEWFSDLTVRTQKQLKRQLQVGLAQGESVPALVKRVRGAGGLADATHRNVAAIVRTATNHVVTQAREVSYEENDDLISGVQFLATLDLRTTATCFSGTSRPTPIGNTNAISRRLYDGDLVVIRTPAGEQLRATPNHPILTARGWLPAHEITPGEDVLYAVDGNGFCVRCRQHVGMPAAFCELPDSLFDPARSNVFKKASSATDFHGDGHGRECKINVSSINRHLMSNIYSHAGKHTGNNLFCWPNGWPEFLSDRSLPSHGDCWFPSNVSAQIRVRRSQKLIYCALASSQFLGDVNGLITGPKERDHLVPFRGRNPVTLSTPNRLHQSASLEESCDRGDGCAVTPCQRCGTLSVPISSHDVTGVRREFFRGHVYNLQTSSGLYCVNGYLVHNCANLDGQVFDVNVGPRPPLHFGCRSTTVPVIKSWRELGLDADELPESTRRSMDGEVAESITYDQWLARHPETAQAAAAANA